jgi:6-phosphofructo-2-kinase
MSFSAGGEAEQSDDPSRLINQPAEFFDPHNEEALRVREQVALATLDYVLDQNGSVGILDATNSTLERRIAIMDRIRARAGPELGVLFLESQCLDENLLQTNMHLKLSGPDYRGKDPKVALEDFRRRVDLYEESYVPLGKYEEEHNIPYLQVIDVSRKLVSHQVNGFLSSQVVYYLLNFNLSPRQIWVTRHGESVDDVQGKIGGNAHLSENGVNYARALARFMDNQRTHWSDYQRRKSQSIHFPPLPGDSTPPNPQYASQFASTPNFCVWTSMLQRARETAQFFDDEVYDVKEMRMLDEMNVGLMDGMTYAEILGKFADDYQRRKREKLRYRFPGTGGEGYLDLINRLKAVIVEIERMTDHVLLVTHRSVARVLLSYFLGLKREDLTDLDIPLGVVYCVEPVCVLTPLYSLRTQSNSSSPI